MKTNPTSAEAIQPSKHVLRGHALVGVVSFLFLIALCLGFLYSSINPLIEAQWQPQLLGGGLPCYSSPTPEPDVASLPEGKEPTPGLPFR